MCLNRYEWVRCTTCSRGEVKIHRGVIYCAKTNGQAMCASAMRIMHKGPTDRTVCTRCDEHACRSRTRQAYQEVMPGLSQAQSDLAIGAWRNNQRAYADFRQQYIDTGIADAQRSGEQVLQQSFDLDLTAMAAFPPPEGMRYRLAASAIPTTAGAQGISEEQLPYAGPPIPEVDYTAYQDTGYGYPTDGTSADGTTAAGTAADNTNTIAVSSATYDYSQGYSGYANYNNGGEGSAYGSSYGTGYGYNA